MSQSQPSGTSQFRSLLKWGWILVGIVTLAGILWISFRIDSGVETWISLHQMISRRALASQISKYADWPYLMLFMSILLGMSLMCRSKKMSRLIIIMMISATLAGIVVNPIRVLGGRARPSAKQVPQGWHGLWQDGQWVGFKPEYQAFPSGHTAVIAGLCGPLFLMGLPASVAGVFAVVVVGGSRLYLNHHHLSDVVTAALLGWAIASFMTQILRRTRYWQV